jgi:transcriptional regulator with XRE-family HTH domain
VLDPRNSLWDVAALTLLRLRKDRGLSLQAVADHLDINRSNVARIESGETPMKLDYAYSLDEWWFTHGILAALVHQATTRHDASWGTQRMELQARATELLIWELAWMPGIFQTEDYARAVFVGTGVPDVEGGVLKRMRDQETLKRHPRIRCLLDEGVVTQPVGGSAVMRGQLARVLELAEEHTVRVVPSRVGSHIGRDGAFWIMTAPDGRQSVYSESASMGRLVRDPGEVRQYGIWFDQISDMALSRPESNDFIRQTMEGFAS